MFISILGSTKFEDSLNSFPNWDLKKSTFQSITEQIVQVYRTTCCFANYFGYPTFLGKISIVNCYNFFYLVAATARAWNVILAIEVCLSCENFLQSQQDALSKSFLLMFRAFSWYSLTSLYVVAKVSVNISQVVVASCYITMVFTVNLS